MTFSPRTLWGMLAAVYFVLGMLMHLTFSLWLVAQRSMQWGEHTVHYSYRDALPYVLPLAAVALVAWLVRSAIAHGTRQRIVWVAGYWVLWFACVAAVDRWLTYSVPEYFHYPQYALLAILLAKTMDPQRRHWPVGKLLLLTATLGAIDELAQYLWITASYSDYFDFNDLLVNLLAAALGVMLNYGFRSPPKHVRQAWQHCVPRKAMAWLCILVAAGVSGAVASGTLQLSPSSDVPASALAAGPEDKMVLYLQRKPGLYDRWHQGPWRGRHWVLGPVAGLGLFGFIFVVWLGWVGVVARKAAANPSGPPNSPS